MSSTHVHCDAHPQGHVMTQSDIDLVQARSGASDDPTAEHAARLAHCNGALEFCPVRFIEALDLLQAQGKTQDVVFPFLAQQPAQETSARIHCTKHDLVHQFESLEAAAVIAAQSALLYMAMQNPAMGEPEANAVSANICLDELLTNALSRASTNEHLSRAARLNRITMALCTTCFLRPCCCQ